jgi:hypothetical protein
MTLSLITVAVALLVLVFVIRVARGAGAAVSRPEELPQHTIPVDLAAFQNLIDSQEEQFLESNLEPRRFRQVQRQRRRATLEYVYAAAHNAAVLLRFAQAARASADPEVAKSAAELATVAIHVRLVCLVLILKLHLPMTVKAATVNFTTSYERASFALGRVVRLQQPTLASRVCSGFMISGQA